jgi:large subunit ribosomal protein L6
MSRVGKMPVMIPSGVTADIKKNLIRIAGPKGELSRAINPDFSVAQQDNTLVVSRPSDSREHLALHGLTRSLVANMVEGVSRGFEKYLEIVGVGYRAEKAGDKLTIRVGRSHPVVISPLPGISFAVEGNRIKVSGIDKEIVGQVAARLREVHPPDTYKGKGIRYAGEVVRLKPGKAGKVVGKK